MTSEAKEELFRIHVQAMTPKSLAGFVIDFMRAKNQQEIDDVKWRVKMLWKFCGIEFKEGVDETSDTRSEICSEVGIGKTQQGGIDRTGS
jgi:hypothetical protein